LIAGAGFWAYRSLNDFISRSEAFKISKIEICGLENITKSEIAALLPFRVGDNTFKVWLSAAEKDLERSRPELKKIRISRGWKSINVTLEERKPSAYVVINNQKLGVDADNKPFPLRGSWAEGTELKIPLILCDDEQKRGKALDFIKMIRPVDESTYKKIESLNVESFDSVIVKLRDGYKIFWGAPEKNIFKIKLKKLFEIQEDSQKRFVKIEYINLNYFSDGRIVVKPLKQ
jgi:cell division septal protein FtsQ